MRFLISIVLFCLSTLSFSQEKEFPYWLIGTWEIRTENGVSYEEWSQKSDSLLFGRTYRVFAKDTLVFDTMKIKTANNEILFEMTANMKNTRVLAGFILSQPTPELWKFENPVTDSPHAIYYWKINPNRVYVWTETMDLEDACMDFEMYRKDE